MSLPELRKLLENSKKHFDPNKADKVVLTDFKSTFKVMKEIKRRLNITLGPSFRICNKFINLTSNLSCQVTKRSQAPQKQSSEICQIPQDQNRQILRVPSSQEILVQAKEFSQCLRQDSAKRCRFNPRSVSFASPVSKKPAPHCASSALPMATTKAICSK